MGVSQQVWNKQTIRLSKTIEDYRRLSKTIEDYRRLSKTIEDHLRLLKTIKDYQSLSKTIKVYRRLTKTKVQNDKSRYRKVQKGNNETFGHFQTLYYSKRALLLALGLELLTTVKSSQECVSVLRRARTINQLMNWHTLDLNSNTCPPCYFWVPMVFL